LLFNSYTFLFLFLPVVLGLYWLALRYLDSRWITGLLLAASLFFYGWWSTSYLWLLVFSIVFNYGIGRILAVRQAQGRGLLWVAVVCNLSLLGYFKYTNFFIAEINQHFSLAIANDSIFLPLAISFFTFQQIAYLVDSSRGHSVAASFPQYALFIAFFPQLIAGPIVRSTEILPQIMRTWSDRRDVATDVAIGLSLFTIGLAKKVVLADSLAAYATPVFDAADAGLSVTLAEAWIGALSYTFQLYFDFSGYSDMAIGLARIFGIHLPVNFLSPYRATSIAEFWRRWHITLSRFLREYLYIPLGGNRLGSGRQSVNLLVTMLLGGIWHGAGWTFLIWGGLHGVYLVINQWWSRIFTCHTCRRSRLYRVLMLLITLLAIVAGWVLFRAQTMSGAMSMLEAMFGINGITVPSDYASLFSFLQRPAAILGVTYEGAQILWREDKITIGLLLSLSTLVVFCLPNTARIFGLFERAGFADQESSAYPSARHPLRFSASAGWLLLVVALMAMSLFMMTNISEFLYYQF